MLKYSLLFSVKMGSDKPVPIRPRLSFNGNRLELYVGISTLSKDWDKANQRIKPFKDVRNKSLATFENLVSEIFKEYEFIYKRYPTIDEFKELLADKRGRPKSKEIEEDFTFVEVIKMFIEDRKDIIQWSAGTLKNHIKCMHHIHLFDPKLLVKNVDDKVLRSLINYFNTAPIDFKTGKKKAPHRNQTIRRNIDNYLRYLRWAAKNGYYKGNVFENFEQRYKGTNEKLSELVYLEWNELMDLYNKDFGVKNYLSRVRDVFCFCCFSSLRFSDVSKLRRTDIRGNSFLISTEKTTDPLSIDLNVFSSAILDKYKDQEFEDDLALPVISMTKTNEYLKEIGEIMKFNAPVKIQYFVGNKGYEEVYLKKDLLSTHAGRRTFVVNSLRLGIPVEVIIKWTGHKDFKALKPYVKIVDELKREQMDKYNSAFGDTPVFTPVKL